MDGFDCLDERIRCDGDAVYAFFDEKLGEVGEIGGALAADTDFDASGLGDSDKGGEEGFDGFVAFVVEVGDAGQVAVEAERELGQVIGANGEAVDVPGKFPGEDEVGGNYQARALDSSFLQITYSVRGGSGFGSENTVLLTLRDGYLHQALLIMSSFLAVCFDYHHTLHTDLKLSGGQGTVTF